MEVLTLYPLEPRVKKPEGPPVERQRSFLRRLGDSFSGELNFSKHLRRRRNFTSSMTVPDSLLNETILSFLSIDEVTDLGLTCKQLNRHVRYYRKRVVGGDITFLRKKRHETRVRYEPWGLNGEVGVWQVQPFSVLLKSNRKEVYQVDLQYANYVWDERENCRYSVGDKDADHSGLPYETILDEIRITRLRHKRKSHVLFMFKVDGEKAWINGIDVSSLGEVDAKSDTALRKSLDLVMHCCRNFPSLFSTNTVNSQMKENGLQFPSSEFVMRQLPRFLYPYFPESFDWKTRGRDRSLPPEFCYHAAPSLKEWSSFMPTRRVLEYRVSEIPWYRHG